ncbi:hypothetical protein HDE_04534 [Halotydeus destructor]|nr:hypothetical protein HDE_04534 [Halotydeus destructor]
MPLGCLRFKIRAIPKALLKQNAALKIRADFIATKDVLCKLAAETVNRIDLVQDKLHKSEQLELIVGDQSLYVSKKLLISESGYFKAKLNFEPNTQSASFEASNVSFVTLKYLIDYLIHGKMNLMYLFDNASTTYQASKYFDVPKLTDYVTKCIPWLSVSSMLKLALSADSHSDTATALKVIGRFSMRPDLVNTKHLCSWAPMIRNHPALLIEFLTIINPKLKSNPKYRLAKAHQDLLVYHLCRAYLSDRMADIARSRIELSKKMSAKALSVYVIAKHHKDGVLCQMALQIILSNMAAIERSALWKKYADDENNEIVSEIRNYVKSSSN